MTRKYWFMDIPIEIKYEPDGEYINEAFCSYDMEKGKFSLTFAKVCNNHIAHECWHLFFRIMQWMDDRTGYQFSELATEMYAWNFGNLVGGVTELLAKMIKEYDKKREN